ncbi:MAG TPA: chemotaxis protein CheB, partial [Verrucomicrobiae bacterium]|nr:chemotaxis protein CheB [Verrucomicrobiae bacterium]
PDLRRKKLLAIGASAGGPAALAKILSALPATFPAGIVIVQHVDSQFAEGLSRWLGQQTQLQVRLAKEGDQPLAGTVLLAGRDRHLVFSDGMRLGYTRSQIETSYCPSIDVFFKSVQQYWQGEAVGVLLTGMGRDGAAGLKALRDRGFHTITQNEASSAVYGMPKAALELQAASEILALDKIALRLTNIFALKTAHKIKS